MQAKFGEPLLGGLPGVAEVAAFDDLVEFGEFG